MGTDSSHPSTGIRRGRRRRSIWFHLHFWIGWLAAIPLLIVCLTGVALAYEHEFYRWEQPEYYALEPAGPPLELPEVLARYEAAFPRLHLNYLEVPHEAERAYLSFATELGDGETQDRGLRAYLDPYTGTIHREFENPTVIRQLEVWHRTLALGNSGRWVIGISSLLLALTSLMGLILWWPMRGRTLVRAWRRGRALDWHNALGLIALLPLVILAITGITFTWGRFAFPILDSIQGTPSRFELPKIVPENQDAEDKHPIVSLESAARQVKATFPDHRICGVSGSRQPTRPYVFHLRAPTDFHPGGSLKVFIDPNTGSEIGRTHGQETGAVGWYRRYFYILHTGHPFSASVRSIWALVSFIGGILVLTGLWISIRRWKRPYRLRSNP